MTEDRWIVDPDPSSLRIGQECEAIGRSTNMEWEEVIFRGHSGVEADNAPWVVLVGDRYKWAAHIRVKRPVGGKTEWIDKSHEIEFDDFWDEIEKPYALVPMTREDVATLRAHVTILNISGGYIEELADRIEAHMPKPKPQRPEIAVDEVITITASGDQAHFAYWTGGMPCVWHVGRTSATAKAVVPVIGAIKTKDGTIWPPE